MSNIDLGGSTPPTGMSLDGWTISGNELFGSLADGPSTIPTAWQWYGETTLTDYLTSWHAHNHVLTRLTVSITDGTGEWIKDATTEALDSEFAKPRALWKVTSDVLTANILMEAKHPHFIADVWRPYQDLFDSLETEPHPIRGSFQGAFYYQENVIPEPSTLIVWSLLGALGVTVGWWRRRRKRLAG